MPDQSFQKLRRLLSIYCLFVMLGSLLTLSVILLSPSEPASALLFGFSASRLIMIVGLIVVFAFFSAITFKSAKDNIWGEQISEKWFNRKIVGILSGIGFLAGWIGCFLPAYRVGILENYWIRAQPIIVFVLLVSLATLIIFFIVRYRITVRDFTFKDLRVGFPLFIVSLLILAGMFISGFGVTSAEDFWYGAGVPILNSQLVAAIIVGILFLYIPARWQSKRSDVLICILIYLITAYLWVYEPLTKNFFFTLTVEPNQAFYPFADAANFDIASQFPLIGQNIQVLNNVFFERPLYLSFLVYLHYLFGQNYETLMAIQAGVFAMLPVLIYLIGRSFNARSIGISSAIVAMLRGVNSIYTSNMIDMANPKVMLTDFPTAIGIALLVLVLSKWLKAPERKQHYLIWIGGAIGLTLMLRTNALLFLVFIPFYVFLKFPYNWRRWSINSGLILLGFVVITSPWEIRNLSLGGQMYKPIAEKIWAVIEYRYLPKPQFESYSPENRSIASVTFNSTQIISELYSNTDMRQGGQACDTVLCFSVNHFLHNSLTSILILPTSPMLDDLRYLIKDRFPYFWRIDWDGNLKDEVPLFLAINLFFVTMGIAVSWKKKRLQGLVPLVVFFVFNISNSLARTSGGRYIVPIDWIISLYYLIGVLYIIALLVRAVGLQWDIFPDTLEQDDRKQKTARFSKKLFVIVILLGFGWLIPLSENLREPRYANSSPIEILESSRLMIEDAGLEFDDFNELLQNPSTSAFIGRSLYPRYYRSNQGEVSFGFYPYVIMDFSRTAFMVIGPTGQHSVILRGTPPLYFPHASDILVIGCKTEHYIDALIVFILDEEGAMYIHQPASGLMCPIQ